MKWDWLYIYVIVKTSINKTLETIFMQIETMSISKHDFDVVNHHGY